MTYLGSAAVLDIWEAGLPLAPAARAMLLLQAVDGGDPSGWPVGRRDRALLRTYGGGALAAITECPSCGALLEIAVDPDQVTDSPEAPARVTVAAGGYRVTARPPTAGDLSALPRDASPDELCDALLAECVLEASQDGAPVGPEVLPGPVRDAVESALEQADPGADISLLLSCEECGTEWAESLDPVRFAWSALESSARRLATDVHQLAAAYGWSEQEILGLSPFRRRLYLSAVQA